MKTKSWTVYDGSLFGRGLDGHPLNVMLDHDLYYRVGPGDDPRGVDRLLAVLNRGAESAGYIHAAKAMAKALEADIEKWGGKAAYARIGFPKNQSAVLGALALMPAGWDEDAGKNVRIDAAEGKIKDLEAKLAEAKDDLAKARDGV